MPVFFLRHKTQAAHQKVVCLQHAGTFVHLPFTQVAMRLVSCSFIDQVQICAVPCLSTRLSIGWRPACLIAEDAPEVDLLLAFLRVTRLMQLLGH